MVFRVFCSSNESNKSKNNRSENIRVIENGKSNNRLFKTENKVGRLYILSNLPKILKMTFNWVKKPKKAMKARFF